MNQWKTTLTGREGTARSAVRASDHDHCVGGSRCSTRVVRPRNFSSLAGRLPIPAPGSGRAAGSRVVGKEFQRDCSDFTSSEALITCGWVPKQTASLTAI